MVEGAQVVRLESVRRIIDASNDPRVARTRNAILAALSSMEARGGPVSVSALSRHAGISRSVFYTHFAGLDELALFVLERALDEIGDADLEARHRQETSGEHTARTSLLRLTHHMAEHRSLYVSVFAGSVSARAYQAAVDRFAAETRVVLPHVGSVPVGVDVEAVTTFLSAGIMGLLGAWIRS